MPFALDSLGEGSMENTRGEHDSLSQEAMSSPDNSRSKDSCFIKSPGSLSLPPLFWHAKIQTTSESLEKRKLKKKKKESESYLG
jgi:hypothetical protein